LIAVLSFTYSVCLVLAMWLLTNTCRRRGRSSTYIQTTLHPGGTRNVAHNRQNSAQPLSSHPQTPNLTESIRPLAVAAHPRLHFRCSPQLLCARLLVQSLEPVASGWQGLPAESSYLGAHGGMEAPTTTTEDNTFGVYMQVLTLQ
jgi:hypothetical protein